MEFDEAVLRIEEQFKKPDGFDIKELEKILPIIASHSAGYSGKAWEYGAKVMELTRQQGGDTLDVFDKIGWKTFQSAFVSSISEKNVIQSLSFTQYNFLPAEIDLYSILNDTRIKNAFLDGLKTQKRPFITPSDLGSLSPEAQDAFAEILKAMDNIPVDDELRLQWSASILRFCIPNSHPYFVASEVLVRTLLKNDRLYSAYYTFRALSENHEDLWDSDIAIEIVKSFIQDHIKGNDIGLEVLIELCVDVQSQSKQHELARLRLLTGLFSVHLWLFHKVEKTETISWEFPSLLQADYPNLSSALAKYITDGDLPDVPPQYIDEINILEAKLQVSLNVAQNELRERAYRGVPLAIKIHLDNLKNLFLPIFESIKRREQPEKILKKINKIDPGQIVTENDRQKANNFPIQGNLLQKMINDNSDIKKSLEESCKILIRVQEIQDEQSSIYSEKIDVYKEFDLFAGDLNEVVVWVFENLLPNLWKRLSDGLAIYKQEDGYHGTR